MTEGGSPERCPGRACVTAGQGRQCTVAQNSAVLGCEQGLSALAASALAPALCLVWSCLPLCLPVPACACCRLLPPHPPSAQQSHQKKNCCTQHSTGQGAGAAAPVPAPVLSAGGPKTTPGAVESRFVANSALSVRSISRPSSRQSPISNLLARPMPASQITSPPFVRLA